MGKRRAEMGPTSRYLWADYRKMPSPTWVHVLFSNSQVMRYDSRNRA